MSVVFSYCTVFPELYRQFFEYGIVGRSLKAGKCSFNTYRFADFVPFKKRIDEPICGHGSGMLLGVDAVSGAIDQAIKDNGKAFTIFLSPHGRRLDQFNLKLLAEQIRAKSSSHVIMVAGRYEGFDARIEEVYADEIISIGDYVLMGGDLPAMVLTEAFLRLVPDIIGDSDSVLHDSFMAGLVDHPHYCLPVVWRGLQVPAVLLSGNHKLMIQWRRNKALWRTIKHHNDWLFQYDLSAEERKELYQSIPSHYVVLMHDQVLVGKAKQKGKTSVTSIDIHDIARSATTYGIKGYFIVTPLQDQKKIVEQFLSFWHEGSGKDYNHNRYYALQNVHVLSSLDEVVNYITIQEDGKVPILIATSAKSENKTVIDYHDRYAVWKHERPILIVLGTGQGLSSELVASVDFLLLPLHGLVNYNHLSVRSAAAIIFDRWLGLNIRLHN